MYEPRDQGVYLRLTASEKEAALKLAEREGVTLPAWLRFMVRRSVGMPAPGDAR